MFNDIRTAKRAEPATNQFESQRFHFAEKPALLPADTGKKPRQDVIVPTQRRPPVKFPDVAHRVTGPLLSACGADVIGDILRIGQSILCAKCGDKARHSPDGSKAPLSEPPRDSTPTRAPQRA